MWLLGAQAVVDRGVGGVDGVVVGAVAVAEAVQDDQHQRFGRGGHGFELLRWERNEKKSGILSPSSRWRHRRAGFGRPLGLCILAAILWLWNPAMLAHLIEFVTNHYVLSGLFVVLLALLIFTELQKGGKSLSTRELTALVNGDQGVVLDVRSHKDFSAGHIVDALNIPYEKINERIAELDKHKAKTLIVVDAMGQHAGTVCRELQKAGFTAAKLSGGIGSWRGDNLPLVK
ncbi:Rhodanese-like domain protein [compost metagenome]